MKIELLELGYSIDDIKSMRPIEAHEILTKS
jgi:hypothetical protein